MIRKLSMFIICIATFLFACKSPKWANSVKDGKQAIKEEYKLSKRNFIYSSLIDTCAVYISNGEYVLEKESHSRLLYDYIRFSNTGMAFISNWYELKPDSSIYNSLTGGQYCFYEVEDDILKLEKYNHHLKYFQYWYGRINKDGDIYFFKYKGRPWSTSKGKLNFFYRKYPAKIEKRLVFPN